jgi:hypothetical protein
MAWLAHRIRIGDCIMEKFYPAAGLQSLDMLVEKGYRVYLPQVKDMVIWVCPYAWRGDRDRFDWLRAQVYVYDRWGEIWASDVHYGFKDANPATPQISHFEDINHDFFHALSTQLDRREFQGFYDCVHFDEACADQEYYPSNKKRRLNTPEQVFGINELRLMIRKCL